jgi:hypothetical protein
MNLPCTVNAPRFRLPKRHTDCFGYGNAVILDDGQDNSIRKSERVWTLPKQEQKQRPHSANLADTAKQNGRHNSRNCQTSTAAPAEPWGPPIWISHVFPRQGKRTSLPTQERQTGRSVLFLDALQPLRRVRVQYKFKVGESVPGIIVERQQV